MKKKVGFLLSFVFLLQGCGQATVMEAIPTTEGGGVAVEEEISESPNATGEDAEYGVSAKGVVGDESQEVKGEGDAISGTERSENERLDSTRPEPKKSESVSLMSESPIPDIPEPEVHEITLAFAGDINFDDNWCNMIYYHSHAEELSDVIDEDYLECMRSADLFWINNEFTYSDRGAPLNGKMYTFRTAPENVELLTQMGVDIVGLANNHVYDYGEEALIDTMDTLQNAGIPYVGAGHDLAEAMSPVYFDLDGFTIAYVAASRAEKFKMTPQATESSPGILRCYDNTLFLEEIEEAAAHADYVIALPHWGTEYSTVLEEAQTKGAKAYIDAGADAVIGAHSHCLQGLEIYADKPVVYSLGNFWFNEKTLDTMMVVLHVTYEADSEEAPRVLSVETEIVPGTQAGYITTMADTPEERRRIFDYLEGISDGVRIDDAGMVR